MFFGSNIGEKIEVMANGARLKFTRDIAAIVLDADGIENVLYRALGGSDSVSIYDLTTTQVNEVSVNLTGPAGSGDGVSDLITVFGNDADNQFILSGNTNEIQVAALGATVKVTAWDPAGGDELVVNGLNGVDVLDSSLVEAGSMDVTLNGGAGEDTLIGGDGDDLLNGGQGADKVYGGPGDDTIVWNPGDGSDLVEGEEGYDSLLFNGANIGEVITMSANGTRVQFTRNIASIVMDLAGLEQIEYVARGGADNVDVADLSGTGVTKVNLKLGSSADASVADGAADVVTLHGTSGDDVVVVAGNSAGIAAMGLAALVNIYAADAALDQLSIDLHDGDDVCEASGLAAALLFQAHGGNGDDVLIGSAGDDYLTGGENDDVLLGGPGVDVLDGGNGNNIVIQD